MGSVGNQSTAVQKSVREEFESLSKAYDISNEHKRVRITKNQQATFDEMKSEARNILKSIAQNNAWEQDYKHWNVNRPDMINWYRAVDLRALQRLIDGEAYRQTWDFTHEFIDKDRYDRDMKVLYIVQHTLNRWVNDEDNKQYIGR